jgi:hypothetical protein
MVGDGAGRSLGIGHRRALLRAAPASREQLGAWLRLAWGISVPRSGVVEGSSSPLDYLAHALLEGPPPRDVVVWASRGAGKTFYGAVATALEMALKPGIEIVILGGSLEQSRRMFRHLRALVETEPLAATAARVTDKSISLGNGSVAHVLAQSHTSVRGVRPQVVRCDEAELFRPDVWSAAQLAPRSKRCGGVLVAGRVEALSTWTRAGGLMREIVGEAGGDTPTRRLLRWNVVDGLETCPPARRCDRCALEPDCAGRAKGRRGGHVAIDDALRMRARVDAAAWSAEMLCERPARTDAVFPEFDADLHVGEFDPPAGDARWVAGVDFGMRSPTVVLWACVAADGVLRVIDERVEAGCAIAAHVRAIHESPWPEPAWLGVDPAGAQRGIVSGASPVQAMRAAGLVVRWRRAGLEPGLRAVRARLAPASGPPTLLVHARCARLIESLEGYRYPPGTGGEAPAKDGHDHACDALRYLVVCLDGAGAGSSVRAYW